MWMQDEESSNAELLEEGIALQAAHKLYLPIGMTIS